MRDDGARHGTRQAYRSGCGCLKCKAAVAKEQNNYLLRRAAAGGPLSIPKDAAVRRLHALMAIGWPRRELAARAGYRGDAFGQILNTPRHHLFLATDERIATLFEELCMTPGPSNLTRRYAAKRGWLPPLAYDDISAGVIAEADDEGEVDEVVVDRILGGEWHLAASQAERCAVVERWPGSINDLERLTGWNVHRDRRAA